MILTLFFFFLTRTGRWSDLPRIRALAGRAELGLQVQRQQIRDLVEKRSFRRMANQSSPGAKLSALGLNKAPFHGRINSDSSSDAGRDEHVTSRADGASSG